MSEAASAGRLLLDLQRSAGNSAARASVQRGPIPGALRNDEGTPEQIAKAISNDDPADVKAINDSGKADARQRQQLVEVLLRQVSLMTFDKRALTRIFNSYGDLEALPADVVSQLRRCKERGYDLSDLSRYGNLILDFRSEVRRRALDNLGDNVELIKKEGARLGVTEGAVDNRPRLRSSTPWWSSSSWPNRSVTRSVCWPRPARSSWPRHGLLAPPERKAKAGDPIYFDPGTRSGAQLRPAADQRHRRAVPGGSPQEDGRGPAGGLQTPG